MQIFSYIFYQVKELHIEEEHSLDSVYKFL